MDAAASLAALKRYAEALTRASTVLLRGQPEDQLKSPVSALVAEIGSSFGLDVVTKTESTVEEIGRPDIGVALDGLLCGYVELKAPGTGADVRRFRDRNRAQWAKFKALPNLVYTDGSEWALYRSGESVGRLVLAGDETADAARPLTQDDATALSRLLRDFFSWTPIVPSTPRALAHLLAPLCHLLRDDVMAALGNPESALSALAREWRVYLFPDADDPQFADAYAQTLCYALLLARLSGDTSLGTDAAVAMLRRRHGLLAQVLRILTDVSARVEIEVGVDLLERAIAAVEPTALGRGGADPWLYFYEDFLAEYDPRLRNDRGVYYTPVQVVQAQVRLVSDLLVNRLDKPLSFASPGVVLLDPAAGTGTYPLAAIQHGLDVATARYGPGESGSAATEMAKNVHAFEILVGPYAVAHLRLSERILDSGGTLPLDGVHVYLTDTLESPHATPAQLPLVARVLGEERRRALAVKVRTPVLVCLGNPPYDRQEIDLADPDTVRKGGWVRFGEPGDARGHALLDDFLRPAREAGAGGHLKNLYNDYVYFWRWALWKVFETKAGPGIVSFITAASYLRGPGFVGMREAMRRTFDDLWLIDLEGSSTGPRRTANVFAINTPVAIAVGVRYGEPNPDEPARVHYAKVEGSRDEKLAILGGIAAFSDLSWSPCFSGWQAPFLPAQEGDYFSWPLLTELFPWQHSGVQLKRTWPIAETEDVLRERWDVLLALGPNGRKSAFRETTARTLIGRYEGLDAPYSLLDALSGLPATAPIPPTVRYGFRSFDRQWIIRDARLGDRMRPALWQAHGPRQVYLTSLLTGVLGEGPAAIVSAEVPDLHHFRGSFGGKDAVPLWRDRDATEPNVTAGLLDLLTTTYGDAVSADDLFAYAYALLVTPTYAARFAEELTIPGPRLPLTKRPDLFRRGATLGRGLIHLHTYGERFADADGRRGVPQGRARSLTGVPLTPDGYPDGFAYDAGTETLRVGAGEIGPIDHRVWDYAVSGLHVVRSWLAYRMADRAGRSSSPLDEIRPAAWSAQLTRELLELLWAIETTVASEPALAELLAEVVASPLFSATDLPSPSPEQRLPPVIVRDAGGFQQSGLALD